MKNALRLILSFAATAVIFSALTGCGGPANTNANNTTTTSANTSGTSNKAPANAADYPPFQSSLADGEIELLDGSKTKISDRKGKVLLINLWATWCGPCRAEMPHLVAMQNQYGDKGFAVLGLDVGYADSPDPEPTEVIKAFAEKQGLNYELGKISQEMVSKFNKLPRVDYIPQSYLIDREGRLRGVFTSGGPQVIEKMKAEVAAVMAEGQ